MAGCASLLLLAGCETAPPELTEAPPVPVYPTVAVQRGDTLSAIAARYGVSLASMRRINALADPDSIYAGQNLRLPLNAAPKPVTAGLADAFRAAPPTAPRLLKTAVEVRSLGAPAGRGDMPAIIPRPVESPRIANPETAEERSHAQMPAPKRRAMPSSAQFEWPVEGKVIVTFGPGDDGQRNDGIDIEADPGTPIHAAAAGSVTYAGQMKGYGKLILIRHDNGYVTAYAHAKAVMVSVGDRVDRGDVIGLSGRSGEVDEPQLHFEIRRGAEPLDPRPLLAALPES